VFQPNWEETFPDHQFWYHGTRNSLNRLNLTSYLGRFGCIKIDVNMDGLPVFKNPPMKFWPILRRLVETLDNPFII